MKKESTKFLMFKIFLISIPLIANSIQTAKQSNEAFNYMVDEVVDSGGAFHRTGRILNRDPPDWGEEFRKILTEASGHEPMGVLISGRSLASCNNQWEEAVSTADVRLKGDPPSILLSFTNENGTQSLIYCQNYRHFVNTMMTTASSNTTEDTLSAMYALLQTLPQGSSLSAFTDGGAAVEEGEGEGLVEKVLTLALSNSCKINIFLCQKMAGTGALKEESKWRYLVDKTNGKLFQVQPSLGSKADEMKLLLRRNLRGSSTIPIRITPSTVQLHIQISGTIQRASLSTDERSTDSLDLFSLQSHAFPVKNLDEGQNVGTTSDQGQRRELDVYVPVSWGRGRQTEWYLDTRGVEYDVDIGGVTLPPSSDSGLIHNSSNSNNKIEKRSDMNVALSDGIRVVEAPQFRSKGPGSNDRNGFLWPELNLLGAGFERPWWTPANYNPDLNGGPALAHTSPISLDVNQASSLTALPGETVQIMFDLTNNYHRPVKFFFSARDQFQYVRNVHPRMRWVDPYETVRISVYLEAQGAEGSTDIVSFTAFSLEQITRNVYLHIGREIYDNTMPDISYSWKGDCENALTPDTCTKSSWGIEAAIQDTESGLLKVISKPFPLRFQSNFVAGTREVVKVQYLSSCCFPKLDLIAYDVKGNVNKYSINVENRWLSWSQILAIVFGCILLIILLALLVFAIARCIRTRRQRNFLGE